MNPKIFLIATIVTLFHIFPIEVYALRCDSKLVSQGDRKIEVALKCGQPDLIEKWEEERVEYEGTKIKFISSTRTSEIEEWTYNFGANRFLSFLTFVNGKLTEEKQGSWGYTGPIPPDSEKTRCGSMVEINDRKIDVIKKCGEPFFTDKRKEERFSTIYIKPHPKKKKKKKKLTDAKGELAKYGHIDPYQEKRLVVNIEEWTFNFGPHHFLYFISFENGKVTDIEQGGYGYPE